MHLAHATRSTTCPGRLSKSRYPDRFLICFSTAGLRSSGQPTRSPIRYSYGTEFGLLGLAPLRLHARLQQDRGQQRPDQVRRPCDRKIQGYAPRDDRCTLCLRSSQGRGRRQYFVRQHRLRLVGIDAPELGGCKRARKCVPGNGQASKISLATGLKLGSVRYRWISIDRFGRTIAAVYAGRFSLSCYQLRHGGAAYVARWDTGSVVARECR